MPYQSVFRPELFKGQTIMITGGGSGIGRCTAHELAALGANVVILGRTAEKLAEVKAEIEEALKRSAEVDANHITVETEGDKVILKGTVRSWFEREEAERAAWRAPGVRKVDNRIVVSASAAAAA